MVVMAMKVVKLLDAQSERPELKFKHLSPYGCLLDFCYFCVSKPLFSIQSTIIVL